MQNNKTVIIMRAVSGSGKTSIAKSIVSSLRDVGLTDSVHSTDDFFLVDGRYVYEIRKLAGYHNTNLENFIHDLADGVDVVICDNMNLLPWQSEPYTNAARDYGYQVVFLNFLPRELEKHVAAQKVTAEKPDAHNLSRELLIRFIDDFTTYDELLDTANPIDSARHFTYIWDTERCERVRTDLPITHFDADHVVTIKPDEYKQVQQTIGKTILEYVKGERSQ